MLIQNQEFTPEKIEPSQKITSLRESAQDLLAHSLSYATRKAYATDWKVFLEFCEEHQFKALGANTEQIILFLTWQAQLGKAPQTLQRRLASIKFMHDLSGLECSVNQKMIGTIMRGIRYMNAGRKKNIKKPLRADMLKQILELCDRQTLSGKRDYAILLFGFSGAFRRSEICNLTVDDLEEVHEGLKVHIRQSKTDQEGAGQIIAIGHGKQFKVVEALKDWLKSANIYEGFIFRSVRKGGKSVGNGLQPLAVSQILKEYIFKIGLDADEYGAHSLRAGFLTEAAEHGASLFKMMEISRHKSTDMVLHYVRNSELFKNHAGKDFL